MCFLRSSRSAKRLPVRRNESKQREASALGVMQGSGRQRKLLEAAVSTSGYIICTIKEQDAGCPTNCRASSLRCSWPLVLDGFLAYPSWLSTLMQQSRARGENTMPCSYSANKIANLQRGNRWFEKSTSRVSKMSMSAAAPSSQIAQESLHQEPPGGCLKNEGISYFHNYSLA